MILKSIKAFDFYEACDPLVFGHKLLRVEDLLCGNDSNVVKPVMTFTHLPAYQFKTKHLREHNYNWHRSCFYRIKTEFTLTARFVFGDALGWSNNSADRLSSATRLNKSGKCSESSIHDERYLRKS